MKKFIALAIAVVMLAALAVPAFAATEGSTTVQYTVGETYTLTVPATIDVKTTQTIAVAVSDYNLLATNNVSVAATSTWKMNDTAQTEFQLDETEFVFDGNESQDATFSWKTAAPSVAGSYTGSITFTGSIVAAAQ